MPLWIIPAVLAAATVVTLGAGIWLLLHLTALARTFAGNADVVAARAQPRASRRAVHVALATFGGGLLVTLAVLVVVVSGLANDWIGPPA